MATVQDTTHQGYKNYETFTVAVVLQNDFDLYTKWRKRADELLKAFPGEDVATDGASYSPNCGRLALEIEEWLEGLAPENGLSRNQCINGIFSCLLQAALSEVDWREVAEEFFGE